MPVPAPAEIYNRLIFMDSRLRVSDENRINQSFPKLYKTVMIKGYFCIPKAQSTISTARQNGYAS